MSTEPRDDGWPDGYRRIVLDEVGSTNAEAIRRAPGLTQPTWIMARRQTGGRGRAGRPWRDPVGNFAASLLMFPQEPLREVALNSFVASLSLSNALQAVAPGEGYALKWPNDVLLNGAKIAGILLESSGSAGHVVWLAVGVGVNLRDAPSRDAVETRALRPSSVRTELGIDVDPDVLLTRLAQNFAKFRAFLDRGDFGALRDLWLNKAARIGETVTARTGTGETTGIFETIDDHGNLVLRTEKGEVRIAAADVYF